MHLTGDSLIDINKIITGSSYIILKKGLSYVCDKIYKDKDLTEDKLYQLTDKCNERKINHRCFYLALLDNVHPFKILFVRNFD